MRRSKQNPCSRLTFNEMLDRRVGLNAERKTIMKYEVYYFQTDKMKCLVEAESEEEAKQEFLEGDSDCHEYVIDEKREFIKAELVADTSKAV